VKATIVADRKKWAAVIQEAASARIEHAVRQTITATLHYDVVDQVAPWRRAKRGDLFHHGSALSAGIWLTGCRRSPTATAGAFDMRGCAVSDIPAADFAWSLDLLVDDLFAGGRCAD